MKKYFYTLAALLTLAGTLSSCGINNHNRKELPKTAELSVSDKVWGDIGGAPRQLAATYDADNGEVAKRAQAIRDKLYPR